ncbi:hypothetical protein BKA63DRAFT_109499 [Paraphoma chrysanthemicola]|nr:hypothetical protein BKA63DRAFT_109499 [Paraphoma chrysanthemicola]
MNARQLDQRKSRQMAGAFRPSLVQAPHSNNPTTNNTSSATTLTPQARRTFQDSFESFERTVQKYSRTDGREFTETTLRDVRDAAKQIEGQLAARQCLRNMKRLEPLLNGLEAYSKVVEVLCNGTPFVSWIWAPIKLLMKLATDHISAFEKLIRAYGQIADFMPRFDRLSKALIGEPDFQQALAVVYSDILEFHRHSYKFFRRNGWLCFFKSSWGQFESRFNCLLESLTRHAKLVDQEANAYLISETLHWRKEALDSVAKVEKERSTTQLVAALAWLGLDTVPHCGQAYQDNTHDRLVADCCDGTTEWILKQKAMRSWLQNGRGPSTLWLKGKPGSGKSTLCAKVAQFLRASRQSTVLFCFYSYTISNVYPDPVVFILATLISQILRQRIDLSAYVYEEFVAEARALSIKDLLVLVTNLLPQLTMPRILVDGIDECIRYDVSGRPHDLTPVREVLTTLLRLEIPIQGSTPPKMLIVSRDILQIIGVLSKKPKVSLDEETDDVTAGIRCFTQRQLNEIKQNFGDLAGIDVVLKEVESSIVVKSQGMYLWVRLVLAQLEVDAYNLDDLETAVAIMPHTLHDLYVYLRTPAITFSFMVHSYSRIVSRISLLPALSRERACSILNWMVCSRRPMRVSELQDTIVFAASSIVLTPRSKLPASIIDLCRPLIQTHADGQVSFVHFTVQEHLIKSGFTSLRSAECCATITCLNYLHFSLNLLNSSVPEETRTSDVGNCLFNLQPYVYDHWLDHLLGFLAELKGERVRKIETNLHSLLDSISIHHADCLDPVQDPSPDAQQVSLRLEPRLKHVEHDRRIFHFLCHFVHHQHNTKLHFRDQKTIENRIRRDPTPLGRVQVEFTSRVEVLLSAAEFPGLSSAQLNAFKALHAPFAFVCRFPGCTAALAGFATHTARVQHEKSHSPPLLCTHSGCKYTLSFSSIRSLKQHIQEFHTRAPVRIRSSLRSHAPISSRESRRFNEANVVTTSGQMISHDFTADVVRNEERFKKFEEQLAKNDKERLRRTIANKLSLIGQSEDTGALGSHSTDAALETNRIHGHNESIFDFFGSPILDAPKSGHSVDSAEYRKLETHDKEHREQRLLENQHQQTSGQSRSQQLKPDDILNLQHLSEAEKQIHRDTMIGFYKMMQQYAKGTLEHTEVDKTITEWSQKFISKEVDYKQKLEQQQQLFLERQRENRQEHVEDIRERPWSPLPPLRALSATSSPKIYLPLTPSWEIGDDPTDRKDQIEVDHQEHTDLAASRSRGTWNLSPPPLEHKQESPTFLSSDCTHLALKPPPYASNVASVSAPPPDQLHRVTSTMPSNFSQSSQRRDSTAIGPHDSAATQPPQLQIPQSDRLPALQPQSPKNDAASLITPQRLPSISDMIADARSARSSSISEEVRTNSSLVHRQSMSSLTASPRSRVRQMSISSHTHTPASPFPPLSALSASSPMSADSDMQRGDIFLRSGSGQVFGADARRPSQASENGEEIRTQFAAATTVSSSDQYQPRIEMAEEGRSSSAHQNQSLASLPMGAMNTGLQSSGPVEWEWLTMSL